MFKLKDQLKDERKVIIKKSTTMNNYLIVLNDDLSYDKICIGDLYSTGWAEPILGEGAESKLEYCQVDGTKEDQQVYYEWLRKQEREFKKGDMVIINRGRKMRGEVKTIKDFYTYRPNGTYGHQDTKYVVFKEDNSKVALKHCDFI
jgi:hypothetical protein